MIIMYEKVGFRWDCGFVVVVGCCWLWWLLLVVVVVVGVVGVAAVVVVVVVGGVGVGVVGCWCCWLLVVAQFRNIQVSILQFYTQIFVALLSTQIYSG